MRIVTVLLLITGLVLSSARPAIAQPPTILTVSGSPAPMVIATVVPGVDPATVSNAATTYYIRVKVPSGTGTVTAQLDSPMPLGTTLSLTMTASIGATSLGAVSLNTTAQSIVTGIQKENGTTLAMTYVFAASAAAGVVPSQSRTVTLTLFTVP